MRYGQRCRQQRQAERWRPLLDRGQRLRLRTRPAGENRRAGLHHQRRRARCARPHDGPRRDDHSGFEEEGFGALSGSVRIWFKDDGSGGERLRVSYSAAALDEQRAGLVYDFDITGGSGANGGGTFDVNGNFVIGGAGYAVTSTTFEFSAGSHPAPCSVTLRDFLGDTVTLRARGDTFDLDFRPFGAPFPLIIPGFLWSAQRLGPG